MTRRPWSACLGALILVHRPMWLSRSRPTTFMGNRPYELAVYLDETRMGGPEVLRQFPPSAATMVRYFDPSSAQGRFGVGNLAGAIQIITQGPR